MKCGLAAVVQVAFIRSVTKTLWFGRSKETSNECESRRIPKLSRSGTNSSFCSEFTRKTSSPASSTRIGVVNTTYRALPSFGSRSFACHPLEPAAYPPPVLRILKGLDAGLVG